MLIHEIYEYIYTLVYFMDEHNCSHECVNPRMANTDNAILFVEDNLAVISLILK